MCISLPAALRPSLWGLEEECRYLALEIEHSGWTVRVRRILLILMPGLYPCLVLSSCPETSLHKLSAPQERLGPRRICGQSQKSQAGSPEVSSSWQALHMGAEGTLLLANHPTPELPASVLGQTGLSFIYSSIYLSTYCTPALMDLQSNFTLLNRSDRFQLWQKMTKKK